MIYYGKSVQHLRDMCATNDSQCRNLPDVRQTYVYGPPFVRAPNEAAESSYKDPSSVAEASESGKCEDMPLPDTFL